jgi:hypothetical protein
MGIGVMDDCGGQRAYSIIRFHTIILYRSRVTVQVVVFDGHGVFQSI